MDAIIGRCFPAAASATAAMLDLRRATAVTRSRQGRKRLSAVLYFLVGAWLRSRLARRQLRDNHASHITAGEFRSCAAFSFSWFWMKDTRNGETLPKSKANGKRTA